MIKNIENDLLEIDQGKLDQNPAFVYLASLTKTGRESQKQALNKIAELIGFEKLVRWVDRKGGRLQREENITYLFVPWHEFEYQHIQAIRTKLIETASPATANRYLSALRRVLKEAWRLGYISAEKYHRLVDVQSIKGERLPTGRELTKSEINALVANCVEDQTISGIRDAAIIALMYAGGLRRDEIVLVDNYDSQTGKLIITGKGNKQRTVYINDGVADALEDWLTIRGDSSGYLFFAINKGDNIRYGKKLSPQAIYGILSKRAESANVKKFSPHDLRRTFISELLDAGADITTVAKMAGHSSVNTTARYDRRSEETKKKAAKLIYFPYKVNKNTKVTTKY